ncbi:heparinase II/III domain-containing protein [Echinicola shivajiensis]|uniref:heparinase II/III domain-containing protein n=1 Tax=Echinicola shivajiensis TaxID=1035916 RepID=UPI001BFC676A|nr:heparinase II/III family protein [Echinicola shivajiensis]
MKRISFFNWKGIVLGILLLMIGTRFALAQEKRNLLSQELEEHNSEAWKMTPELLFSDKEKIRESFVQLPLAVKEQIKQDAEKSLSYDWPSIPLTAYLDFVRNGDRTRMQSYQNRRITALRYLVLGELLEAEGNYIDAIADGVWALCEQSTWVLSAHLSAQKAGAGVPDVQDPVIDLGAGEVGNLLAWIHFYFRNDFETISPLLVDRIEEELNERIISPYLERDDFWWMGFNTDFVNNWNPWCNYNVLLVASLIDNDEDRKQKVIEKTMKSVDQFINYYKADGACEEGPAYWDHAAGKMMEYLELLKVISNEEVDLGNEELIQNMGNYIRKAHISGDYYVNFADASASLKAHPGIIFRYGEYINDDELKGFSAFIAQQNEFEKSPFSGSLDRVLHNLLIYDDLLLQEPSYKKDSYFSYVETEVFGGISRTGFFFAAKGGHNNESHNHNDVGSFILYSDGLPVLIDIGVGTYSAKTFSEDRYDIWTMQSDFHNLPIINGVSQRNGDTFKAGGVEFKKNSSRLIFSLELQNAYPNQAASVKWKRSYDFNLNRSKLLIKDRFDNKQFIAKSELHFMSYNKPEIISKGRLKLGNKGEQIIVMEYPGEKLEMDIERKDMKDVRLEKAWGKEEVYRISFFQKEEKISDEWRIAVMVE